jgi:hypothetical protein
MNRIVLLTALLLAALLAAGPALAQDMGDPSPRFVITPSFSVGYVGDASEIVYSLDSGAAGGIGGVLRREFTYRNYSQLYIEGGLALDFGDRLATEVITRWALPVVNEDIRANDFAGAYLGGRTWRTDTLWGVVDGNVSYDLFDPSSPVSLEPKVGIRWDYWRIWYGDPYNVSAGFGVASPTDTADFYSSTIMPYAGLTFTVKDLRKGMFGGDLVIDAEGGPLAWGRVRHYETRDLAGTRHDTFKGRLARGYFYEVSLDYTLLTLDFSPKVTGTVGVYGKLSGFHTEGNLTGRRVTAGTSDDFDYEMDRTLFMTGIRLAVMFDIFGKPAPVPTPPPAPVIEPKLEPMTRN